MPYDCGQHVTETSKVCRYCGCRTHNRGLVCTSCLESPALRHSRKELPADSGDAIAQSIVNNGHLLSCAALPLLKHQYTNKDYGPWTTVASNAEDVTKWFTERE